MTNQDQSESKNQPASSPRNLGQILENLAAPQNLESTPTSNAENSLTITSQKEKPAPIGTPLSEHGLGTLRALALNVQNAKPLDDKMLEMLLAQHFGPSRFVSAPKLKHSYEGGYDCEVVGHQITLDALHDSEMKIYEAVEFLNRPANYIFVAKCVAKMRVTMARSGESNEDITILCDAYAEHMAEFPPDVVKSVCDKVMSDKKWFPLISEMRKEMIAQVSFRRALWETLQEKRNPLLAAKAEAVRVSADPRLSQSWKSLPRAQWAVQHYEWAIEECQGMLKLANEMPHMLTPSMWEDKIKDLTAQKLKAFPVH